MPDLQFFTEMFVLGSLAWLTAALVMQVAWGWTAGPVALLRRLLLTSQGWERPLWVVWAGVIYSTGSAIEMLSFHLMQSSGLMRVVTLPSFVAFKLMWVLGCAPPDVEVVLGSDWDPGHDHIVSATYESLERASASKYGAIDLAAAWETEAKEHGGNSIQVTKDERVHAMNAYHGAIVSSLKDDEAPSLDRASTHFRMMRGATLIGFLGGIACILRIPQRTPAGAPPPPPLIGGAAWRKWHDEAITAIASVSAVARTAMKEVQAEAVRHPDGKETYAVFGLQQKAMEKLETLTTPVGTRRLSVFLWMYLGVCQVGYISMLRAEIEYHTRIWEAQAVLLDRHAEELTDSAAKSKELLEARIRADVAEARSVRLQADLTAEQSTSCEAPGVQKPQPRH